MGEPGPTPADRVHALVGRTIAGKFLVASYLGGGAVGAVYKDVAIKVLHGEHAGDAMFAARFEREAKAASKLDHPNSMRVLDFGVEPDGVAYIAMEYLDGRHLLRVMDEDWPLPPARVADITAQALAAVGAADAMGIVHRDLKPENIMVLRGTDDEGQPRDVVKVCDFGIAKFIEDRGAPITGAERLTQQGIVVGTPEYMSPEQCRGDRLDVRSDLYSMGVILYQLVTGRVPFDGPRHRAQAAERGRSGAAHPQPGGRRAPRGNLHQGDEKEMRSALPDRARDACGPARGRGDVGARASVAVLAVGAGPARPGFGPADEAVAHATTAGR
jgi:serine/threonine-protein kinase